MSRLRTAKYQRTQSEDLQLALGRRATTRADRLAPEIADWSDMADERVFRSQLRRRVFSAILALPAIYRAPVMLRDIQGMSTEEASAMLHVKDQTLKSRLHRGRLILRQQLATSPAGSRCTTQPPEARQAALQTHRRCRARPELADRARVVPSWRRRSVPTSPAAPRHDTDAPPGQSAPRNS